MGTTATDLGAAERANELREHPRLAVYGGNAEITSVHGRGREPGERARIVNWSRGGLLLKVKSPRRRFFVQRLDPVLFENDTVSCTLRLPPSYKDHFVRAHVVHVARDTEDADSIAVGLRFDLDATTNKVLGELASTLEPRPRSVSGRLPSASGRLRNTTTSKRVSAAAVAALGTQQSQRAAKPSQRTKGQSQRVAKTSERVAKTSERAAKASQRVAKQSQRLQPPTP